MAGRDAPNLWAAVAAILSLSLPLHAGDEPAPSRVRAGLAVLYDFRSPGGVVRDRSDAGDPLDLKIGNRGAVRAAAGALELRGSARVASGPPAREFVEAVRVSGGVTVEAWVTPANTKQDGPARIVTLSRSTTRRNVTLGQDGDRFEARLRTTATSDNGTPGLATPAGSLKPRLTHVVFTHTRDGRSRIYLDGELAADRLTGGDLSTWDDAHRLVLGDELSGDRPWRGTLHLVALHTRGLTPAEVARNFRAGPEPRDESKPTDAVAAADAHFRAKVAPLLSDRCVECHDADTGEGGLVLDKLTSARTGGDSGPAVVPGDADGSLLWQYVDAGEMPPDGPALSDAEKSLLRDWIDAGARWPADAVLPLDTGPPPGLWVRRLTVPEYVETVRAATGVDVAEEAARLLPPDVRADGFSNTAYNMAVDLDHVAAHARLAETVVQRMDVPAFAAEQGGCRPLSAKCLPELIERGGTWLLRGPLDRAEADAFRALAERVVRSGGTPEEAAGFVIESMLQSPRFLYRVERRRGDGAAWPVTGYELASRLSYALWGGPPDGELFRAARDGELVDRERVRRQIGRMLDDPRAGDRAVAFAGEWLNLGRLADLRPNGDRFPGWSPALAADMRDETRAFVRHVAWDEGRPLTDLFDAQVTFATPRLAEHYGDFAAGDAGEDGPVRVDLSAVPGRGGLLTQGSVLTVGGDEGSTVTRGLFVLEQVLRGKVSGPPAGVDTTPVPPAAGLSHRDVALARIADANCGGCHVRFEPLAFGLGKFDGLGRFRETDPHGNALRDDGTLTIPGGGSHEFGSSAELMALLAGSDRVAEGLTWKLAQFVLGRPPTAADRPELERIHRAARDGGFTYRRLITAVLLSDLVLKTRTE